MTATIGLILDHEPPGGYSKFPWYALRENYFSCLREKGARCLALFYDTAAIGFYLDTIDALVITGGKFDVNPALYGDKTVHSAITLKDKRTQFEWAMTEEALKRDLPVLGICGGHQLLNVIFGGTLIQHIPDEVESALQHEQPTPRNEGYHKAEVIKGTLLHKIVSASELLVNSAHHQAIKETGKGLIVNAMAPDGVIEGIESTGHKFCLGLQWHPEFFTNPGDHRILEAFVQACKK